MSRRSTLWFWACVVGEAALLAWIAAGGRAGAAPTAIACGFALAFVPYAGLLYWAPAVGSCRRSMWLALIVLCLLGSPLLLAPPLFSDDIYRYLWEGRVVVEGFNPYELPPNHHALSPLRDEVWRQVNHRSLSSIYPPLAQALFAAIELLGGSLWLPKLFALLVQGASVPLIATVRGDSWSPWALALNPLLLCEGPLNGHFDLMVGVLVLLGAWALANRQLARAFTATSLAVGLKVVGLLLVPLFTRHPRWMVATVACSAALLLPMAVWTHPTDEGSGVAQFASKWRGNDGVYSLVASIATRILPEGAEAGGDAERMARAVVLFLWVLVAALVAVRRPPPLVGARVLVWTALLLSPQVHPWYLAWLLPIEVACGGFAGLVWSASVWTAYAPLDRWVADRVWTAEPTLALVQYGSVALALLYEWYRGSIKLK